MINLQLHAEGVIVPVRAQPGARKNAVVGEQNGALKLAVTAPADQGKANKALVELLCNSLDLKRSHVELLKGDKSRDKRFLIRGLSLAEIQGRLADLLNPRGKKSP
ncbi:MAG TPA: DUF167 domain-containing protein [Gemmataceae bacterium]|nr:DUF167 domain-containing protein [Gemmataceae bacterium]